MSVQPIAAYVDSAGQAKLRLSNGHTVDLPASSGGAAGPQGPTGATGPQGPPGTASAGAVVAGAGLSGGGNVSPSTTLNVVAGPQLHVTGDAVRIAAVCTTIANWNSAVDNGWYRANGALNAPDTGWFYGLVISHGSGYCTQRLFPFGNSLWTSGTEFWREQEAGVWGDWNRHSSYIFSRGNSSTGPKDAGTFAQHNGAGSSMGVRRAFWGVVKDAASASALDTDAWRVNNYTSAGVYAGQAITIPLGTGIVSHPQGHNRVAAALAAHETVTITADVVATLGVVKSIVGAALAAAGVVVDMDEILPLGPASDPVGDEPSEEI